MPTEPDGTPEGVTLWVDENGGVRMPMPMPMPMAVPSGWASETFVHESLLAVERERVNAYRMDEEERREIEGEWLQEIEGKGFPITRHARGEPCFSCTLTRALEHLPDVSSASTGEGQ